MPKLYSKIDDYVFRKSEDVTNVEDIHLKQLKNKKKLLERSILRKQKELDLVNYDISEAKKIGVDIDKFPDEE